MTDDLLPLLERYYDEAPRPNADPEEHGPFTIFVSRGGFRGDPLSGFQRIRGLIVSLLIECSALSMDSRYNNVTIMPRSPNVLHGERGSAAAKGRGARVAQLEVVLHAAKGAPELNGEHEVTPLARQLGHRP